ncbi:type VI secretion system ATPase TssH [Azohydromonas lata]|uniref:Type VI secretion system ATPase TssH n=1 Tax=Azohydromonas lata TaxID=45677 RepID=A0ABU5IBE3_9BURK|nr:type VI secretion system ATPase TssH [Azohydromonas lata]MDZ5456000.1 type VI secretion system ATPase TssH [Azohydromonas lata]
MSHSIATLVGKLNDTCRDAATRAASLTLSRGHAAVDVEHLLLALLDVPATDLGTLCCRFDVDAAALQADLEHALGHLLRGPACTPVFGDSLLKLLEQAGLIASLDARDARVRSAHLLLALLTQPALAQIAHRASRCFARFPVELLRHQLDELTQGSRERPPAIGAAPAVVAASTASAAQAAAVPAPAASPTPALDQFTLNLTQRARDGALDPVIGRDAEIRQAMDILMRRRQNNPLLTGEAGVGKTAVVEGLALRIAAGDVPEPLRGVALHTLDLGLLQAGAGVKGEFESRLKNVIAEVRRSPHPIVLFIDEAHALIGAGGAAGQLDAANLLKPALARGELRTIAATTWSEYRKYFEKDAALARRFELVKVEEPTPALAAAMLRGMAPLMERHFRVRIRDEAITEAVRLSSRYLPQRQLPDKAVSVLDTACARVALAHGAQPAAVEELRRQIERLDAEAASLHRDPGAAGLHGARLQALQAERREAAGRLDALCTRHAAELQLVKELQALEDGREGDPASPTVAGRLAAGRTTLASLQAQQPLVPLEVDAAVVADVVSAWSGVPLGRLLHGELDTVLGLQALLARHVIGQDHALAAIAQRVRTGRAQLQDPDKPRAVLLFVGPSGVGKTETALALAELLYGGRRNLITLNLSEYQEAHAVSGLKGSPPGYVGYGEGGVLTEAVRRNPYSVLLLDEAEKAHPDVLELFFQVFDKGEMDDAEGRAVDFRHCVIILASNAGAGLIRQACLGGDGHAWPDANSLAEALHPHLARVFKPALLARMAVVPYYPLSDASLRHIVGLKLDRIAARVARNHQASLEWGEGLIAAIQARCTEGDGGARNVDHLLDATLLPTLAEQVLQHMAGGQPLRRLHVGTDEATGGFTCTAQ